MLDWLGLVANFLAKISTRNHTGVKDSKGENFNPNCEPIT
jgi:hypothetical protein